MVEQRAAGEAEHICAAHQSRCWDDAVAESLDDECSLARVSVRGEFAQVHGVFDDRSDESKPRCCTAAMRSCTRPGRSSNSACTLKKKHRPGSTALR